MARRVCLSCQTEKHLSDFPRSNGRYHKRTCRECDTKRNTARVNNWRAQDPDRHRAAAQKRYRDGYVRASIRHSFKNAMARAAKLGIAFDIQLSEFEDATHCQLTGIEFRQPPVSGVVGPFSPSIDRVEPGKGYVRGNTRVVLMAINAAKGTGTDEDLIFIATKLLENRRA